MRQWCDSAAPAARLCLVALSLLSLAAAAATKKPDAQQLKEALKKFDQCMVRAAYSFTNPELRPPINLVELAATCKRHGENLKCVKDGGKTAPAIIKRGLAGFVANRQRLVRKYCTNLQTSQLAKRFVDDYKCIMDKRLAAYRAAEIEYVNSLYELERLNLRDSASELKYFCCATYKYRKGLTESETSGECPQARETTNEVMASIVPSEINLLCEDEDKLTKICQQLKPLSISKELDSNKTQSAISTGLYLVATLGEPAD